MNISKSLPIKFYTSGLTYNESISSVEGVMEKIFNQQFNSDDIVNLQFYDSGEKDYRLYVYDEDDVKLDEATFSRELLNGNWYYSLSFQFGSDFSVTNQVIHLKIVEVFTEIEGALTDLIETATGTVTFTNDTFLITGTITDLIETASGEIVTGYAQFITKGTFDDDTTAADVFPVFMASIIAGDLILVQAINVQGSIGSIQTPSGFTLLAEETFSWGTVAWFYKIAVGSETGALTVTRTGSSNSYLGAQIYQIRHYNLVVEDSDANSDEANTTAQWDALTIAGEVRSLIAMLTTFDGSSPVSPPTGYTQKASDSSIAISGTELKLYIKENVSSAPVATVIGASYNGWATMHLSTHNS